MKTKILILGNEFIKEDSLAVKLSEKLSKELPEIEFIHIKTSFQLMDELRNNDSLVILDVVEKLNKTTTLKIEDLQIDKIASAHDFDAAFFLKLLGQDKQIIIIGIPQFGDIDLIKRDVISIISRLL